MAEEKRVSNELDFARVILSLRKWWRDDVVATVNQEGIVELRREEADLSSRFLFMTMMSAGIAILGLIQSSPAVVIGAMLIAPLMGPIIGLGFAMASGDYVWLRKCAKSVAIGATLAVIFCAVIVFLSPLKTVTAELAARTAPTPDLSGNQHGTGRDIFALFRANAALAEEGASPLFTNI